MYYNLFWLCCGFVVVVVGGGGGDGGGGGGGSGELFEQRITADFIIITYIFI